MFVGILATVLEIVHNEQSATGKNCKMGNCNKRRVQNENIVTCESVKWKRAIPKKSATRKKVQHENITTQKRATWTWCAVWKKCNMKNMQHEEIQIATVKYGKSAQEYCTLEHKRITGRPLTTCPAVIICKGV